MRVALAQVDPQLGDVGTNLAEAGRAVGEAGEARADVVVFPELSLHGYALGALAGDRSLPAADPRLARLSEHGPDVLVGLHEDAGLHRYNSAAYYSRGALVHTHRKLYLPNYLAWEERKHSSPGQRLRAFDTRWARVATLVCNDAWQPALPWLAAQDGAEVLFIPSNSASGLAADAVDVPQHWSDLLRFIARMQQCWVVFVNRVGHEGGASFWGGSRVLDPGGELVAEAPSGEPSLEVVDIDTTAARRRRREVPLLQEARLGLVSREVDRLLGEGGDA